MRDLLKAFAGLAGAVITIDAMHTQGDTAQVITGRGADYVMTVKANMPTLYKRLKKLPWTAVRAFSAVSTDHGRRARRTIKVTLAPAWIEFARRCPGRAAAPHGHDEGQEDRRGRLPHHQRPRRRSRRPGGLGPGSLGDRKPPSLGPRRDLPGRQIPGQNRERAPGDGRAAQPGHQPPAHRWPRQHRRRQPPPRPRPAAHAQATSDRMNDFAGSCQPPDLKQRSITASSSTGRSTWPPGYSCPGRSRGGPLWKSLSRSMRRHLNGSGAFPMRTGHCRSRDGPAGRSEAGTCRAHPPQLRRGPCPLSKQPTG